MAKLGKSGYEDFKIGLIGIGRWGKELLRNFADLVDVPIVCHTGSPENKEWLAENYPETSVTTKPGALFARDGIDAVAIATPIGTHYDLVSQAIEADLDVFVEKPLAESVTRAEELRDAAAAAGVDLFVGYIYVYHPLIQPIYEAGKTDGLTKIKFTWSKLGTYQEDFLLDVVCHPISILYHHFGKEPTAIEGRSRVSFTGDRDAFSARLSFGDAQVELELDRFNPQKHATIVAQTSLGQTYVWTGDKLSRAGAEDHSLEVLSQDCQEPLAVECTQFLDAVVRNEPVPTNAEFGVEINRVVEQLRDGF